MMPMIQSWLVARFDAVTALASENGLTGGAWVMACSAAIGETTAGLDLMVALTGQEPSGTLTRSYLSPGIGISIFRKEESRMENVEANINIFESSWNATCNFASD